MPSRQHEQTFEKEVTRTVSCRYLLFLPEGYAEQQHWPLMMFLHGAGERGNDLRPVKIHGPPKLVEQRGDFPFVLVSPQCPPGRWWSPEVLSALLDEILHDYSIDEDRVYLTGLSMGGFGTWRLAIEHPDRFAAIAPVCGGGTPYVLDRIKHIPTWVFHGAKDGVVPLSESQRMVDALEACGGNVKFTVYPEAEHDSWTETYDNPELYEWFLSHRRVI